MIFLTWDNWKPLTDLIKRNLYRIFKHIFWTCFFLIPGGIHAWFHLLASWTDCGLLRQWHFMFCQPHFAMIRLTKFAIDTNSISNSNNWFSSRTVFYSDTDLSSDWFLSTSLFDILPNSSQTFRIFDAKRGNGKKWSQSSFQWKFDQHKQKE